MGDADGDGDLGEEENGQRQEGRAGCRLIRLGRPLL